VAIGAGRLNSADARFLERSGGIVVSPLEKRGEALYSSGMRAVCLFDIDGTLLTTGGAGQLAMERALSRVFGIHQIQGEILAAGRTDRAITSDLFRLNGLEVTEQSWRRFLAEYFQLLPQTLAERQGRVLPGVRALLEELSGRADVSLGLLTGNFRDGAAIKLRHYRIDHHFAYGGFGDEHHERDDVARVALQAAANHLRRRVSGESVWVIGDTPSDVRCARAVGARAVAVATGIFSSQELEQTEPDLLLEDFRDADSLLRRMLG
jgi:phosphoglycolate phosphatase